MVVEEGRTVACDTCRHCKSAIVLIEFGGRPGTWYHDGPDSYVRECPHAPVAEPSTKGSEQ